jgi:tetratricopeptide (TPR) repeat protein/predicted aspartyl protease
LGLKGNYVPGMYITGVGGSQEVRAVRVKSFTIAGATVPNVEFGISGSEHGRVGLLGMNILSIADSEYDFAHGVVRFFQSKDCANVALAYWATPEITSVVEMDQPDEQDRHIAVPVYVNGVKLRALLDTGAQTSVLTRAAAARAGMKPGSEKVEEAGYSAGVGRRTVQAWIAPFESFKIGGEEVRRTRLRISDFDLPGSDMLLGADFFLSHRVYVAPKLRRVYFTHNGGPVFAIGKPTGRSENGKATAAAPAIPLGDEPADAAGYAQRGRMRAARGDLNGGIEDLNKAIARDGRNATDLMDRGQMLVAAGRLKEARADLDRVIGLRPGDAEPYLARASLRLAVDRKDASGVADDLQAAAERAPEASNHQLTIADLYATIDNHAQAIPHLDLWITHHPDDRRRGSALNSRCWSRALSGRDLDLALNDCNAALRFNPGNAAFLDSRGLVRLRRGEFARAVADYDAALAKNPKMDWSLYGRGLAKIKLGQKNGGEADIKAATSENADIADIARRYGVVP